MAHIDTMPGQREASTMEKVMAVDPSAEDNWVGARIVLLLKKAITPN